MARLFSRWGHVLRRAKRKLCRALCPDEFYNEDASREIDRLTVRAEQLEEQLAAKSQ